MSAANRARPDIHKMVALLSMRVKEPNETDWKKFVGMINYLNGKNKKYLTLSADNLKVVKFYVGESFLVHPDVNSRAGVAIDMLQEEMKSVSSKYKLNTSSSTEAE